MKAHRCRSRRAQDTPKQTPKGRTRSLPVSGYPIGPNQFPMLTVGCAREARTQADGATDRENGQPRGPDASQSILTQSWNRLEQVGKRSRVPVTGRSTIIRKEGHTFVSCSQERNPVMTSYGLVSATCGWATRRSE